MEKQGVKTRLLEFLKAKRISQTEFTGKLGVSPTYIGAMRKGIPADKLKKISELYPDLNRDWLLYGEGSMIKENVVECEHAGFEVPLLPVEAIAGSLQMWSQGVSLADCRKIVAPVPGADFAIQVSGDSMEPKFHDGSMLLIKKINERAFIPWGHPMVIDSENGVLIKKVLPYERKEDGEDESFIWAVSENPAYPKLKIPTESIYGLYRVMGSFELYSTY